MTSAVHLLEAAPGQADGYAQERRRLCLRATYMSQASAVHNGMPLHLTKMIHWLLEHMPWHVPLATMVHTHGLGEKLCTVSAWG